MHAVAVVAKLHLDPMVQWQESRQAIARFDGYLVNIRMYGFTLVTVLLTVNALVTTGNTAVDRPAASIVIMALLLALFMLDNYYWELLRGANGTARALENKDRDGNSAQLSGAISAKVATSHATDLILAVYGLFVLVAAGIGLTASPAAPWGLIIVVGAPVELAVMLAVFLIVQSDAPNSKWFYETILPWFNRTILRRKEDPPSVKHPA